MPKGQKFSSPFKTAKGEQRAYVPFRQLETLWFNTGTLCNLECQNCYIESGPRNDRLSYLTSDDILPFLSEIEKENYPVKLIGLTGGEPFLNPHIFSLLEEILSRGFPCLILTNAYKVISKWKSKLSEYNEKYPRQIFLRVSLDHYTQKEHENQRGNNTFSSTIKSLRWLLENQFQVSIAGRILKNETMEKAREGFESLFRNNEISFLPNEDNLVLFPEMEESASNTPEITTACWDILGKGPEGLMCSSERMIVKPKNSKAKVQACTLIPYKKEFQMGDNLKSSFGDIYLNHPFCSSFCVLGGSSCSKTY